MALAGELVAGIALDIGKSRVGYKSQIVSHTSSFSFIHLLKILENGEKEKDILITGPPALPALPPPLPLDFFLPGSGIVAGEEKKSKMQEGDEELELQRCLSILKA